MIKKYGFVRVASAISKVKIANTLYNIENKLSNEKVLEIINLLSV